MMYATTRSSSSSPSMISQSPPRSPDLVVRDRIGCLTEDSRCVRLELIANDLRSFVSGHCQMDVIGPSPHRMQYPAANLSVFAANRFDFETLGFGQQDGFFRKLVTAPVRKSRLRQLVAFSGLAPASGIPWQPGPVSRPGNEIRDGIIPDRHGFWGPPTDGDKLGKIGHDLLPVIKQGGGPWPKDRQPNRPDLFVPFVCR